MDKTPEKTTKTGKTTTKTSNTSMVGIGPYVHQAAFAFAFRGRKLIILNKYKTK